MKKTDRPGGANIRRCVACGQRANKREHSFIRIARSGDGIVQTDFSGTAPGRGVYVCGNAACVQKLCKERRLSRFLRGAVPDDVYRSLAEGVGLDVK